MNGTSADRFSPDTAITRGMVVTVLYRLAGSPYVSNLPNPFSDVAKNMYYENAVKWASKNSIVFGYSSGKFGPNDNISRQDIAVVLKRYSDYSVTALPTIRDYAGFQDNGSITDYAQDAVEALFKAGVINGKLNNRFDPKGNATRAEFAAVMHRLSSS